MRQRERGFREREREKEFRETELRKGEFGERE